MSYSVVYCNSISANQLIFILTFCIINDSSFHFGNRTEGLS